jgi:competence protein ComEA
MKIKKALIALVISLFTSITLASSVNINTANADQIAAALNGVGSTKAQAIVKYRAANGDFSSAGQIVDVTGIGTVIYEKNKADILVK